MMWGAFAIMALAAVVLATLPLWRRPRVAAEADRLSVYGRQLAEIDGEAARGLLTPEAAQAARLEVERRILRLGDDAADGSARAPGAAALLAGAVAAAVAGAVGLYLVIGHPGLPDQPAQHEGDAEIRQSASGAPTLNALLDRLIGYLDENPEAMEGWAHLRRAAPTLGREADLAAALERAVTARPGNIDLRVLYAESLILMGRGQVGPAARLALDQAAEIDPGYPAIRYYNGLALMQQNKPAEAEAVWAQLLAEAPADAEWRGQIADKVAEAQAAQGKKDTAKDMAAAVAALPADEQMQQIRAMVDGLAARLETAPDDGPGWLRLARAWRVLGDLDKATAALERGRAVAAKSGDTALQDAFAAEAAALKGQ